MHFPRRSFTRAAATLAAALAFAAPALAADTAAAPRVKFVTSEGKSLPAHVPHRPWCWPLPCR